jgi:hypothetical protein
MPQVQTETFTLLAICEWFNTLNCRSERQSALSFGLFQNPWLLGGLVVGNLLQVAVVFTASALLLFAANTAVIGNYHVQVALSRMKYLPPLFAARSFRFGTPHWAILFSAGVPILVVIASHGEMETLGHLYAFGLLGSFTLKSLGMDLIRWRDGQRGFAFWLGVLATIMVGLAFAVNLVAKPAATLFGGAVAGLGLLGGLATQHDWWSRLAARIPGLAEPFVAPGAVEVGYAHLDAALADPTRRDCTVMVALRGITGSILREARVQVEASGRKQVYLIYVDEIPGLFYPSAATPTPESLTVLKAAKDTLAVEGITAHLLWDCSHGAAGSVAEAARGLGVSTIVVGASRRNALWALLRGRFVRDLLAMLPPEIRLIVID